MTSMNISVPDSLKEFVERQVEKGGYGTASEYLRELIREAQRRVEREETEAKLIEALAANPTKRPAESAEQLQRIARRRQKAQRWKRRRLQVEGRRAV